MKISVHFFGPLSEAAGCASWEMEVPEGLSVGRLEELLGERWPALRRQTASAAFAVNEEYCRRQRVLGEGDEVALIPPVSGG